MENPGSRPPSCPATARGFTLIELMIVVAVIAILAVIAVSSYDFAVIKSRRGAAKGCVQEGEQYMERFYTTHLTYAGAVLPGCSSDVTPFYTVGFSGTPDTTTYTVQAIPTARQNDGKCGTLSVNQAGAKTPTTDGCW